MSKNMRSDLLKKINDTNNPGIINLANMAIKDDEISEIMENLKLSQPGLSVLDLDNNQLSDDGALILAQYLFNFHHITELSLQYNNIGRKGAISIFSLKKLYTSLDILFHGNKIHDVGEMAEIEQLSLAESITTHPVLVQR
ncbi:MAG: hypothetical protein Q8M03_05055 [Legionella sp.]|nr:hypothetical protein [Legionella sp.]